MDRLKGRNRKLERYDWKLLFTGLFLVQLLIRFGFHNSYIVLPDLAVTCSTLLSGILYLAVLWEEKDPFGELCMHIPYLLIGLASYLITGTSAILVLILAMLVLKNVDQEMALKWYIVIRILTILLIVAASLTGVIPNQSMDVLKSGVYTITLHAYGYNHPNQFALATGSVLIACICAVKPQSIQWKMAALGAAAAGLYFLNRSRSMILVIGFVFLCKILLEFQKPRKIILHIWQKVSWLPHVCLVFLGMICPFLMDYVTGFQQKCLFRLDALFSMRFSFAAAVIRAYPLNPFGNVFDFSALEKMYGKYAVDNGYVNFLYNFGSVVFILFLYLSYCTVRKMLARGQAIYAVAVIAMLLWGVFENIITLPTVNFTILFYGMGVGNLASLAAGLWKRRKHRS